MSLDCWCTDEVSGQFCRFCPDGRRAAGRLHRRKRSEGSKRGPLTESGAYPLLPGYSKTLQGTLKPCWTGKSPSCTYVASSEGCQDCWSRTEDEAACTSDRSSQACKIHRSCARGSKTCASKSKLSLPKEQLLARCYLFAQWKGTRRLWSLGSSSFQSTPWCGWADQDTAAMLAWEAGEQAGLHRLKSFACSAEPCRRLLGHPLHLFASAWKLLCKH